MYRYIVQVMFSLMCVAFSLNTQGVAAADRDICKSVVFELDEFGISPLPDLVNGAHVRGSITGEYRFVLSSALESITPGVVFFQGTSTITTTRGDLHFYETGAVDTSSPGHLGGLLTIVGGDEALRQRRGQAVDYRELRCRGHWFRFV